jgi:hypothetical protein
MDEGPTSKKKPDVLFVHSKSLRGDGYRVVRAREDRVEIGEMSDVKEGEPLRGEVVKLRPREESPRLFDVDVVVPREQALAPTSPRAGPAQVASETYRKNFEAIFGRPRARKRELLN